MVKPRNKKDFNWVINKGHFGKLVYAPEPNLFLVDTGVIIDMENAYRHGYYKEHPAEVLERIAGEYPLVITPRILQEIEKHANCRVNGNKEEISEPILILMRELYNSESVEILENNRFSLLDFDFNAYPVYLASKSVFQGDYKKGEKDEMSCADRELVTFALLLSKGTYGTRAVGGVNVLSSDEHIPRTIHAIKTLHEFRDYKVRAISTRNDLRSYLNR